MSTSPAPVTMYQNRAGKVYPTAEEAARQEPHDMARVAIRLICDVIPDRMKTGAWSGSEIVEFIYEHRRALLSVLKKLEELDA